jgi:hypothetical protein
MKTMIHQILSPALLAAFVATVACGCKSTSKGLPPEETIQAFEVKLTTATRENAEAYAELALVVDYADDASRPQEIHRLGRVRYEPGQTTSFKLKTDQRFPWKARNQLRFSIVTQSEDGYLPSLIWIAAVSDRGERFTLRYAEWGDKMFSIEPDDPEAAPPVVPASGWVIPLQG